MPRSPCSRAARGSAYSRQARTSGLKAILGLAGVHGPLFDLLFPPNLYEPPGDFVFEVSGVLQLPAGLLAGHSRVSS